MAEVGGFESIDDLGAVGEGQEQSQEQFREQMRRAQKALKQLKKEEGKAQQQDGHVAHVIVKFLHDPKNTDLFLLISRCVGHDIPSELILAVLALVDQESYQETEKFLQGPDGQVHEPKRALIAPDGDHLSSLAPQQRQLIDIWVSHIVQVASRRPQRGLVALVKKRMVKDNMGNKEMTREVSPPLVQLSAFIMRRFFASQKIEIEFEELHGFMEVTYVRLVARLEEMLKGQKQLGGAEEEDEDA